MHEASAQASWMFSPLEMAHPRLVPQANQVAMLQATHDCGAKPARAPGYVAAQPGAAPCRPGLTRHSQAREQRQSLRCGSKLQTRPRAQLT